MTDKAIFFDPVAKENSLKAEAESWDTMRIVPAEPEDIPVIDVGEYFESGSESALDLAAKHIRHASENIGFYILVGHSIPKKSMNNAFEQTKLFHQLSLEMKNTLLMDQPGSRVKGVGYLPIKNRKLPHRVKGNENEALLIKWDRNISLSDNLWPDETLLPKFRSVIEDYAARIEALACRLLPIYGRALNMNTQFFAPAFEDPFCRLRMTHYPKVPHRAADQFGIAPHVDTTFITLLATNSDGLCVYSEKRHCWVSVPVVEGALIVNTGELLKQWTNDVFVSIKHFANNNYGETSRYSIPFFFNASTDYKMKCIPSCCSTDQPARYPPISYAESQGVVQGE